MESLYIKLRRDVCTRARGSDASGSELYTPVYHEHAFICSIAGLDIFLSFRKSMIELSPLHQQSLQSCLDGTCFDTHPIYRDKAGHQISAFSSFGPSSRRYHYPTLLPMCRHILLIRPISFSPFPQDTDTLFLEILTTDSLEIPVTSGVYDNDSRTL